MLLYYSLAAALPFLSLSAGYQTFEANVLAAAALPAAQKWPVDLVGTWSTKSLSTLTGPGFFNPISDQLIEPEHTGISYSFTNDGYYEEAYFRAISEPADPSCPQGVLQWQHGKFVVNATGSILMVPIMVDGRQLLSNPCAGNNALYMRYNNTETMNEYSTYLDPYHDVQRLNLFMFNGEPLPPMYLVYDPPQMLPTTTLNPTTASGTATGAATNKAKKRSLEHEVPLNWKKKLEGNRQVVQRINADRLWWIGLGMTGVGGLLYLGPRRMGIMD